MYERYSLLNQQQLLACCQKKINHFNDSIKKGATTVLHLTSSQIPIKLRKFREWCRIKTVTKGTQKVILHSAKPQKILVDHVQQTIDSKAWVKLRAYCTILHYNSCKEMYDLSVKDIKRSNDKVFGLYIDVIKNDPSKFYREESAIENFPQAVDHWKHNQLTKVEYNHLSDYEKNAYQRKQKVHDKQKKTNHKTQVQIRQLQIVNEILDSTPFAFSTTLLAESTDAQYLFEHISKAKQQKITEKAKQDVKEMDK